jgi:VanZ family protein
MGKSELRIIVVRKWVTVALLCAVSAAMAGSIYWLSGRAYANESTSMLVASMLLHGRRPSNDRLIAGLMPALADVLLFLPWGFLCFVAVDRPSRRRPFAYAVTFVAAIAFASALSAWQLTLPTRVTTFTDSVTNGFGALAGAFFGHVRKQVRVRFRPYVEPPAEV